MPAHGRRLDPAQLIPAPDLLGFRLVDALPPQQHIQGLLQIAVASI